MAAWGFEGIQHNSWRTNRKKRRQGSRRLRTLRAPFSHLLPSRGVQPGVQKVLTKQQHGAAGRQWFTPSVYSDVRLLAATFSCLPCKTCGYFSRMSSWDSGQNKFPALSSVLGSQRAWHCRSQTFQWPVAACSRVINPRFLHLHQCTLC